MFAKFKELSPSDAMDKTYGGRSQKSVWPSFDEVATDIQKFRDALRRVKACNPIGVTEVEILSMSIAVHLGKRDTMSYEACNYPANRWRNHLP